MEQNQTNPKGPLSPRQLLAMPFIASASPSITQGAKAAGISRSTLIRWRKDPNFRAELERMRNDAASLGYVELQGLVLKGISALAQLLEDENPRIRLSAIRSVLNSSFRSNDANYTRNRFDIIDKAIALLKEETAGKQAR